ncbi:MAG: ArsR/SmtB family transcription factor [Thermomicrobiales bacterium]
MPSPRDVRTDEQCEIDHVHIENVRRARATLPDYDTATHLASLFDALGDPTRVRLLTALMTGALCVCDLTAALGISQSAVSHQLRLLRSLHLVRSRRAGKMVWYSLDDVHVNDLLAIGFAHVGHRPAIATQEEEQTA